jgi:CSLREA domain-containing protein
MALQPTSAAIDAGDDAVLGSPLNLTTDQRGPGFLRKQGTHVDVGAFEFQQPEQPQSGPTFIVTTTDDHDNGICGPVDCTLREAINAANAGSGGVTITFASAVVGTITLGNALPVITTNVNIQGPGARVLAISGNGANAVFSFTSGTSTVSRLSVNNGLVVGSLGQSVGGGGIFNQATLTLSDCTLSSNRVQGGNGAAATRGANGNGGAIYNGGVLSINRCTLSGNSAIGGAGGGTGSTGSPGGRGGFGSGGAVYNDVGANLTLTNCTIANNSGIGGNGGSGVIGRSGTAGGAGGPAFGAVVNNGTMTMTACAVSGNTGTGGAGGSGSPSGTSGVGVGGLQGGGTVTDTIVALNTATGSSIVLDVSGSFTSNGYNLIGDGDFSSGFTATGDQVGTTAARINPQLGALQNNGGSTDTLALLSNSPAINNGDPNAPSQDQRYYLRSGASDVGAFEFQGALAPVSAGSRKSHGTAGIFDVNLPLTSPAGIECRTGGATNDHQLIVTFPAAVTVSGTPQAQVTSGTGQIGTGGTSNGGVVTLDQTETIMTVPLTNVANAQRIVVTLFSVGDGVNTNNVTVPMSVLAGDTTANGSVNSSDIAQTQSQSGQPVTSSNFREDVTVNGGINSSDVAFVQSKSGTAVPVGTSQSEDPTPTAPNNRASSGKSF